MNFWVEWNDECVDEWKNMPGFLNTHFNTNTCTYLKKGVTVFYSKYINIIKIIYINIYYIKYKYKYEYEI